MEYFVGSFLTLIVVLTTFGAFSRALKTRGGIKPKVTQSQSFSLISPYVNRLYLTGLQNAQFFPETQSRKHNSANTVKLVIYNSNAYWIQDKKFYTAKVINGDVDRETTKLVDTMSMSAVELNELSSIVDKLTEGMGNDSSNSGNQKF